MENRIELKPIKDLLGMKFSIPNYQRGYRWTKQQVQELLDDIWEFSQNERDNNRIYCLQPLVVCEKASDTSILVNNIKSKDSWTDICEFVKNNSGEKSIIWEVIDGQQRLTTLSIILQVFEAKEELYSISYDTLKGQEEKINDILHNLSEEDAEKEINYHFMNVAKDTAIEWLKKRSENNQLKKQAISKQMVETIKERVKLIWYQTNEEEPISVFTRLNVGRISLTSSELIKALFLNRENFGDKANEVVLAKQMEIAQEWDKIENQLQDDEFWLFLRNLVDKPWEKPTRIDFLLEFLYSQDVIEKMNEVYGQNFILPKDDSIVGKDSYRTFRAYYECYKMRKIDFTNLWDYIKEIFEIWTEWYNDSKLYHYVGYVLTVKVLTLDNLVKTWLVKDNEEFIKYLVERISKSLKNCNDLNRIYKTDKSDRKRDCIPLLLLHNVETIVRQNEILTNNQDYQLGVFYKFPFHLYKIEHWDVEHVDSSTQNELKDDEDQKNWILSAYQCLKEMNDVEFEKDKPKIDDMISAFFSDDSENDNSTQFSDIYKELSSILNSRASVTPNLEAAIPFTNDSANDIDWKNKVQNYVLLDRSTNRDYKNALFPDKRSHIIGKEKGMRKIAFWTSENIIDFKDETFKSAFVPLCTKNVFQKTYSVMQGDPTKWDVTDSIAYKKDLFNTLKEFGVYGE